MQKLSTNKWAVHVLSLLTSGQLTALTLLSSIFANLLLLAKLDTLMTLSFYNCLSTLSNKRSLIYKGGNLGCNLWLLGPVQTGTERNGTERNRSKKWNAEGLRSDGITLHRTVPFHKLDLFNK